LWVLSQAWLLLYFYLDNGSNVCGLEFNYKNEEQEGDSDNKSLLGADKAEHETFYNDQIFRQLFLGFEVKSEEGRWVDPEFKKKEDTSREVEAGTEEEVQPLKAKE